MKITRLEAENVKRLRAVEITPNGAAVVIGGKNAQGKSSVLDAIKMAFGGKKAIPPRPVRDGADEAHIVAETETLVIERTFDAAGGTKVVVRGKDGGVMTSPQTLLDKLYGDLSFDPLAFMRMPPDEQALTLRALVGLDFTKEEALHKEAYDERTLVGREAKRLLGAIEKLEEAPPETPDEEVDTAALASELERRLATARERSAKEGRLSNLRLQGEQILADIARLENELAQKRAVLEKNREMGKALRAELDAEPAPVLDDLQKQIADAGATNALVRRKKQRADMEAQLDACEQKSKALTKRLGEIESVIDAAIRDAKYPVAGLSVSKAGVLFNGLPLEQASQAEQIRVSVAMGLALNPELRVLLIRDGSLLDADNLRVVAEMAQAADAQVWIERVGADQTCSVIIEDGQVKA